MLISFNKSFIVNPRSAIIAPQHFVNSTSEIEQQIRVILKKITPFGVKATRDSNVLW